MDLHKNSIDLYMLRRRIKGLKVAAVSAALIEERRVAAASVVGQITTANTAAAGVPPFTLELFAVAAMGFFPGTEVGVARQAFNMTTGYLYQVCDRMFLGEASHTLLHMHVVDFGEHIRAAFPGLDLGAVLLDETEATMSQLDDLVFQFPLYGVAILPHLFDFIAPGMCTSWTSLSASLASRAWAQHGTHAFDWAQQVSHYGNMTLVTLANPAVDAARGLATHAAGLLPDMTLGELEAWVLAASLPQTAALPAAPAQLRSTIVDPHANPADDTATGDPASAAGAYIRRAIAGTARMYICHPRATT